MIEVIKYPTKVDWRVLKASCHFCDCVIEATFDEYEKAYDRYMNLYYQIKCPFCGRNILVSPADNAEVWVCGPATRPGVYEKVKVEMI